MLDELDMGKTIIAVGHHYGIHKLMIHVIKKNKKKNTNQGKH
jgi:hypothetical protein